MSQPIVLVTQPTLAAEARRLLTEAGAHVAFMHDPPISEDELIEAMRRDGTNAILLRGSPPLTRRVLESAPGLRIVSKHGAGIDSVDLDCATQRGIAVVSAAGANADAVAEYAIAMMLALARDLPAHDRRLRAGEWRSPRYVGREFRGRTVGIVGYGAIGRRTARLAQAFGANVLVHSRSRPADLAGARWEAKLERLLADADIVSLHCPLNEATRHMINQRTLALMKPDAILINTGRGKLIDEPALHAALAGGRLAAAGLEVFEREPVDPANPLLALPNVLASPHVAPNTRETALRLGMVAATQIVDYLRDGRIERTNLANPAVLERLATR